MLASLIILGFFGINAVLALIIAAATGEFRRHIGELMGLFIGAPLLIGLCGIALGLAWVVLSWIGSALALTS